MSGTLLTPSARLRVRRIRPHSKGCRALQYVKDGKWKTPWFVAGDPIYRDRVGTKRGSNHRWILVICNCCDCDAEMLIKGSSLEEMLSEV